MQSGTPSSVARFWRTKPFAVAFAVLAIASLLLVGAQYQASTHAAASGPKYAYSGTHSGTLAAPQRISMQSLMKPVSRTSQQLAQLNASRQAGMARLAQLRAPKAQHVSKGGSNIAPATNHQFSATKPAVPGPQAAGDGIVEQNVNVAGGVCSPDCAASYVQESSVAGDGKYLWQTGNWYSAVSSNGGASWGAVDPYVANPNFCCDQTVNYEPNRNIFIWQTLALDFGCPSACTSGNAVQLYIYSGQFGGGCVYTLTSANVGDAADQVTDFPKVTFGTDDTYVTWNDYDKVSSSWLDTAMMRLNTDQLAACTSVSYNSFTRSDVFTFNLVLGSTEGMNFASWYCVSACTDGSQISFFAWSESSGSYGNIILNVNPFNFNFGGQFCGSADGIVTNWCGFADARGGGAYLSRSGYRGFGGQVIGFAISAAPDSSHPFTYVVREYFVLPTMTYKGSDAVYSGNFGITYPGCADSPYYGHVSCTISIGGGTGSGSTAVDLYPSTAGFMEDKQWPTQAWFDYYLCVGAGNAGSDRWGDYTTTHEWSDHLHWMQADWCMANNSGGVLAYTAIVGEQRNHNSYLTWITR